MANVLIADGCTASRHFLFDLLNSRGHDVTAVGDGLEALQRSKDQKTDLVICDVLMQTIDGYEFLARLRANSDHIKTPVVFYVNPFSECEAQSAVEEFLIAEVLVKSADPTPILEAVIRLTHRGRKKSSVAPAIHRAEPTTRYQPVEIDPQATVFILDDDPSIHRLLGSMISDAGLRFVAYSEAQEFLDDYTDQAGCLILDLELPKMTGIEALEQLRSRGMHIPTIILTAQRQLEAARFAIRLRAFDLLEKPVVQRSLLARVHFALQEDARHRSRHAEAIAARSRISALTRRELELLQLIATGLSSKRIAAGLGISVKTVNNHRSHLLAKTGAINMADLVRMRTQIDHVLDSADD